MPRNDKDIKKKKFSIKKFSFKRKPKEEDELDNSEFKMLEKKKKKKLGFKIFKIVLFSCLALGIIGVGVVLGVLSGIIDGTENVKLEELQMLKLTTFIYDKDGKEIGNLFDEENRVNVEYKNLPKTLVDAVVAIEDARFWTHNGVDAKRTLGAIFTYAVNAGDSSFGGSTITQQLVKNVTGDKESDWTRKIREWYRAISLETKLSKEQIMESYLNTIYMGAGASGVEVASRTYFDKGVKDINLAESATLAAVIQLPEAYNPYKSEAAAEKLKNRKEVVLYQMLKQEKITRAEYDEAIAYKIVYKKGSLAAGSKQTYFVDAVIEEVVTDLMEAKNVTRGMALKMIYGDGYKVYTTMDPLVQTSIDNTFANKKYFYASKNGSFMQAAMVVLDQKTGNVVGLSGGAGDKTGDLSLNRAIQTTRQPGSSFKPIAAYGPSFEQGKVYPGMGLDDVQKSFGNWTPKNYYAGYNGYVSARNAIKLSMNLPAIESLQIGGIEYAYDFAKRLGISSLDARDKNLSSLALGGLTYGVSVMDMAGAYASFANAGIYTKPKLYTKVLDRNDKEILKPEKIYTRVMKDSTAFLITDCLKTVVDSGTGTYAKLGNIAAAGKTGNTNDDYDEWFAGFSPYYTAVVWNGYDTPTTINRGYPYPCIKIWKDVMAEIHKGKEAAQFTKPNSVIKAEVCTVSGLAPTDACRKYEKAGTVVYEWFAAGTVPTKPCDVHKLIEVCDVTGKLPTEFCPGLKEVSYITRTFVPNVKPGDWNLMAPTETCPVHITAPIVIPPVVVDPYAEVPTV